MALLTSGPQKEGTKQRHCTGSDSLEGQASENVYTIRSDDRGKTWSPLRPIEPAHPFGPPAAWANPVYDVYSNASVPRVYAYYTYNVNPIHLSLKCQWSLMHRLYDIKYLY